MDKPPSIIILVRHGARLDAADPQWHLTSPTPYDPPLTYGGWKQAQALGARIGSILKFRQDAANETQNPSHIFHRPRRRMPKIIVHSSPFLRCIQTSIALSAGMDHWAGKIDAETRHGHHKHHTLHSGSPHTHALDPKNSPHLTAIPEPEEEASRRKESAQRISSVPARNADRPVLRLDPFLGEWLSPDYFENITPPPGSKMMLASAKAELLRRADPIDAQLDSSVRQGPRSAGCDNSRTLRKEQDSPKENRVNDGRADQKPFRLSRAKTHSAASSGPKGYTQLSTRARNEYRADSTGYSPPTPPYAILPSQPIPPGYVAHARDACIQTDFQWDSMRQPLNWGNGGEYGEEWSSMHKRFRKGLNRMVAWYRGNSAIQELQDRIEDHETLKPFRSQPDEDSQDDGEETVLILVTHGAGCNALIGALTNQPVLIDVGLASLTMAVLKKPLAISPLEGSPERTSRFRRNSLAESRLSEEYDVKLTASMDHLRPGSQFLGGSAARDRSPSLPTREKSPYRYERHVGSPTRQTFRKDSPGASQKPGSQRKTIGSFEEDQSPAGTRRVNSLGASNHGLWSKPNSNSGNSGASGLSASQELPSKPFKESVRQASMSGEILASDDDESPTTTKQGLWQAAPKRRWTFGQA